MSTMSFRSIEGSGDWNFGQGVQSYFRKNDAIAANVQTRLLFFLNDFFAAMDKGIPWWDILGSKNPTALNNVLLQTRKTIIESFGVVKITSVNAVVDSQTRKVFVSYNFSSIYSTQVVGSVQVP